MSSVSDTALATFCESYESAHTKQDLTADIAGVYKLSSLDVFCKFFQFLTQVLNFPFKIEQSLI